jgi:hypothetical protein
MSGKLIATITKCPSIKAGPCPDTFKYEGITFHYIGGGLNSESDVNMSVRNAIRNSEGRFFNIIIRKDYHNGFWCYSYYTDEKTRMRKEKRRGK